MGKTTIKSERVRSLTDLIAGTDHVKTTISNGKDRVDAHGANKEQAVERAKDKWEEKKLNKK